MRRRKNQIARIRNLALICTFSAVVFSVSTYAWFVGMRTVNVSNFEVEIASAESLMLSLDGQKWNQSVTINKDNYSTTYSGNTNSWGGDGLSPVSTVGEMDSDVSRMILYEKASLTATPGGYRLLASRVNNFDTNPEQSGYVVFDLFVKNISGSQYIPTLDEKDEEAIYLTTDSEAGVAIGGVENTGIENSVRVAFAQVGRVIGTETNAAKVTGITCTDDAINGVTGICRTAQIWEPNDTKHIANAISWYTKSCKARTGDDVTSTESYSGNCSTINDGTTYPTYAVKAAINNSDNVDVYDGIEYNGYTVGETYKLYAFPYFTDTMKLKTGTERQEFMKLSPNSITKVRVYIYIEGQDVDNYDFASIGKKIAVKFGFTKERYTDNDINYTENGGPQLDTTAPVITLNGNDSINLNVGDAYVELGATALDDIDAGLTDKIVINSNVNTAEAGTYTVTYTVSDSAGNETSATRTIVVQ